ncbi:MAG: D-alanyl-D-alanine carboxypeptidase [Clostridiaceae bacterium]|nr:D-alanyl-D-alanine carboxypeptidase [Clostridiaceae bacterium]
MKNVMLFLFAIIFLFTSMIMTYAEDVPAGLEIQAKSAILIDAMSGSVLFSQNAEERVQIASVTKIMTMLLIMEAINAGKITYDEQVTASDFACSMGGSQVYLEPGEQMSVKDMLKAIAVASANDASVAMAEHVAGSAPAFINAMNKRAKALDMKNTIFENCTGLDTDGQYSTAVDVAKMSRELIKHQGILEYLTIWIDSLRNGEFGLSNTNRLIRFYPGAVGIKTGSTDEAKYCLSAAATRNDLTLIAVVLAAETSDERFNETKKLLDYGFANYVMIKGASKGEVIGTVTISKGEQKQVEVITANDFKKIIKKEEKDNVELKAAIPEYALAPIQQNQKIGELLVFIGGKQVGKVDLVAKNAVPRIKVWSMIVNILKIWAYAKR